MTVSVKPANPNPQPASGRARVLELRAKNIKCIREVSIDLASGDIHEIRGDSGQGKTAVLQAIEGALRGLDPEMVRNGESAAEIELHLSTATINRIVPREGKETLMVRGSDGSPIERAKDFLATICGPSAFRPIEWVRLGGGDPRGRTERLRKQRDQLLEALSLSLTAQDVAQAVQDLGPEFAEALGEVNLDGVEFEQHALLVCAALERACYEYRGRQNALAEQAENVLKLTPAPDKAAPAASAEECQATLNQATQAYHRALALAEQSQAATARAEALRTQIASETHELAALFDATETDVQQEAFAGFIGKSIELALTAEQQARERVESLRVELMQAETDLTEKSVAVRDLQTAMNINDRLVARRAELAELEAAGTGAPAQDTAVLKRALDDAQEALRRRQLQDRHNDAAAKAADARARSQVFDQLVSLFRDTLPKGLIAQADLPVEGLTVDADKILIQGVPLHQLGTSDQIRVGVLIASALNPHSGFVLVDGAESMGSDDRKALAEAAHELGLQLIMTYVDEAAVPAPGVTVMRQGEAVGASPTPVPAPVARAPKPGRRVGALTAK